MPRRLCLRETGAMPLVRPLAQTGCGDESRTRIISFTRRALLSRLSYAAILVDREGLKPSREVCRTSMLSLHHQPVEFGGCGWIRTTNLALMRRLLYSV